MGRGQDRELLLAPAGRVTLSGVSDGEATGATPSGLGGAAGDSGAATGATGATGVSGRTEEVDGGPGRPAGPSASGGAPAGKTMSLRAASALPAGGPGAAAGDSGVSGAGSGATPGHRAPSAAPPRRADMLRIVDRVQKKDTMNIFRDPVTDAVVRRPPGLRGA